MSYRPRPNFGLRGWFGANHMTTVARDLWLAPPLFPAETNGSIRASSNLSENLPMFGRWKCQFRHWTYPQLHFHYIQHLVVPGLSANPLHVPDAKGHENWSAKSNHSPGHRGVLHRIWVHHRFNELSRALQREGQGCLPNV